MGRGTGWRVGFLGLVWGSGGPGARGGAEPSSGEGWETLPIKSNTLKTLLRSSLPQDWLVERIISRPTSSTRLLLSNTAIKQ